MRVVPNARVLPIRLRLAKLYDSFEDSIKLNFEGSKVTEGGDKLQDLS
jgi:hypothetical protein